MIKCIVQCEEALMKSTQMSGFLRVYLLAKRAYPRCFPGSLAIVYGLLAYSVVDRMLLGFGHGSISSLAGSLMLFLSLLACGASIKAAIEKETSPAILLVAATFVAVAAAGLSTAAYFGWLVFFGDTAIDLGIAFHATIFALLIGFDRNMDVAWLDL